MMFGKSLLVVSTLLLPWVSSFNSLKTDTLGVGGWMVVVVVVRSTARQKNKKKTTTKKTQENKKGNNHFRLVQDS